MSEVILKNKIRKSLDNMDAKQLQSAWHILQAISVQKKYADITVDHSAIDKKIAKGIQQLDNDEGTDFGTFLNEITTAYGSKR